MVSLTAELKCRTAFSASEVAFDVVRPLKITPVNREKFVSNSRGYPLLYAFEVGGMFDPEVSIELSAL